MQESDYIEPLCSSISIGSNCFCQSGGATEIEVGGLPDWIEENVE